MQQIVLIGAAGALGALARYGLAGFVQRVMGGPFPWGTAFVNVLGSFLFGLIWSLAEARIIVSPEARTVILTGFMGAFTTFSTFMFETSTLAGAAQWSHAVLNLLLQVISGLIFLHLGMALGRLFIS